MSSAGRASAAQPTGDHGPAIEIIQVFMILLSGTSVVLRFVARRLGGVSIWWDDWTILAATFFSFAINITNFVGVGFGMGKHIVYVKDDGRQYLQTLFALELTYTTSLALNKIGVLLMYRRLFGVDRRLSLAVNITMGVVIAWWISVEAATLAQCRPVSKLWDFRASGQCFEIITFIEASAVPNVLTDIAILLIPQPLIWKLRLHWSTRLGLCAVFLLGAFTACTSIGRLVAISKFKETHDFTWDAFGVIIWYSIEPPIGIACACLPCLGPLFRRHLVGSSLSRSVRYSESDPSATHSAHSKESRFPGFIFSPWGQPLPGEFDAESIAKLRPASHSGKDSVRVSTQGSIEHGFAAEPAGFELNVIGK